MFNNNFAYNVLRQVCDKEGRYIILDLEVGELILTICNIYTPNKDDPFFFQNVSEQMLMFHLHSYLSLLISGITNLCYNGHALM